MKIVLLSTQRSGSTLVCDDFAGTGKLGIPTEHYLEFLDKNHSSLKDIENYFKNYATTENGVQSVKIMANQLSSIDELYKRSGARPFRRLLSFNWNKEYRYLFNTYKNAQFIRIIRQDKVAQAVSMIFSRKTNIYHLVTNHEKLKGIVGKETSDDSVKNVQFEYSKKEISQWIEWIRIQERTLDKFIELYNIEPFNVIYEDIINSQDYIQEIANVCGIGQISINPRTLKKIGGKNSEE